MIERPLVSFGRSHRQRVFSEQLTRIWRRPRRQALLICCFFSRKRALRIFLVFDRNQRLPCYAVEHVDEALLACLYDGINCLAIALELNQNRRGWEVAVPQIVTDGLEMPNPLAGFRV